MTAHLARISRAGIVALALGAAPVALAADAPPTGKTETVIVVAPANKPADATIDMHGDDSGGLGDYVSVWPKTAFQVRRDGAVKLSCVVDRFGLAESCTVVFEDPPNVGFGQAALELRPTLKLTPAMGPNGPITSTMTIALRFKAPRTEAGGDGGGGVFSMPGADGPSGSLGVQVTGNPIVMRDVTMMNHPVWVAAATFDDIARAYPAGAGSVDGYAVLHCHVLPSGEIEQCQIIKETPKKSGFAAAALGLAPKFRILPELARTKTPSPLWVDLAIRFPAPGGASQHTVNAPVWLAGYDPQMAASVFPPQAAARGLTSGVGAARCTVGDNGVLTHCTPDTGAPEGLGFSQAAVTLASVMKMNLWSADAAPVAGAAIIVKIEMTAKPQ